MADLLEFLDSVSIDVVKRKYYNANKVNAVFEELREHAAALMQENEQLRHALNSQSEEQQKSLKALESLQAAYREALSSAHARADEMLDSAAAESSANAAASIRAASRTGIPDPRLIPRPPPFSFCCCISPGRLHTAPGTDGRSAREWRSSRRRYCR